MIAAATIATGATRPEFTAPQGLGLAFSKVLWALLNSLGNALGSAGSFLKEQVGERFANLFGSAGSFSTNAQVGAMAVQAAASNLADIVAQLPKGAMTRDAAISAGMDEGEMETLVAAKRAGKITDSKLDKLIGDLAPEVDFDSPFDEGGNELVAGPAYAKKVRAGKPVKIVKGLPTVGGRAIPFDEMTPTQKAQTIRLLQLELKGNAAATLQELANNKEGLGKGDIVSRLARVMLEAHGGGEHGGPTGNMASFALGELMKDLGTRLAGSQISPDGMTEKQLMTVYNKLMGTKATEMDKAFAALLTIQLQQQLQSGMNVYGPQQAPEKIATRFLENQFKSLDNDEKQAEEAYKSNFGSMHGSTLADIALITTIPADLGNAGKMFEIKGGIKQYQQDRMDFLQQTARKSAAAGSNPITQLAQEMEPYRLHMISNTDQIVVQPGKSYSYAVKPLLNFEMNYFMKAYEIEMKKKQIKNFIR